MPEPELPQGWTQTRDGRMWRPTPYTTTGWEVVGCVAPDCTTNAARMIEVTVVTTGVKVRVAVCIQHEEGW